MTYQERQDLEDNQSGGNTEVSENARGTKDGEQDQQGSHKAKGHLEVNDWIPDLLPHAPKYMTNFKGLLENYCTFYQEYVQQQGRTQWGCKMPAWPIMQLGFLLQLFPDAKVIYIDRPLEECVISSRTINMCLDEVSTQQFRQFFEIGYIQSDLESDFLKGAQVVNNQRQLKLQRFTAHNLCLKLLRAQ